MKSEPHTILILSDATPTWLDVAENSNPNSEFFVFSPFITGPTILEIFQRSTSTEKILVTALSVEAYLSRAIDVRILKQLISRGIKVFHFPNLHAKLVYSKPFAVAGSQNFTHQGRKNFEVSVLSVLSNSATKELERTITELISNSNLITEDLLNKYILNCQNLQSEFDELQIKIESCKKNVEKFWDKDRAHRKQMMDEIESALDEGKSCYGSIKLSAVYKEYWRGGEDIELVEYLTLMPRSKTNSLNFFYNTFTNQHVRLKQNLRYLCLDASTAHLYWIKANRTQTTNFLTFNRYSMPESNSEIRRISINLVNPNEENEFANINIRFYDVEADEFTTVLFMFTGKVFHLIASFSQDTKTKEKKILSPKQLEVCQHLKIELPHLILRPFENVSGGTNVGRVFDAISAPQLTIDEYMGHKYYIIFR